MCVYIKKDNLWHVSVKLTFTSHICQCCVKALSQFFGSHLLVQYDFLYSSRSSLNIKCKFKCYGYVLWNSNFVYLYSIILQIFLTLSYFHWQHRRSKDCLGGYCQRVREGNVLIPSAGQSTDDLRRELGRVNRKGSRLSGVYHRSQKWAGGPLFDRCRITRMAGGPQATWIISQMKMSRLTLCSIHWQHSALIL